MDIKSTEKSSKKSDKFNPKAFHTASKDQTKLKSSSKSFRGPYDIVNKAMQNASMLKSLRPGSKNSEGTRSSCFLRPIKRDHGSSQNNKGFSDEDKKPPVKPNPRIVITNEDGGVRKLDERSNTANPNMEVVCGRK